MSKPQRVLVCLLTGMERTNWINPDLAMMLFHMARNQKFSVELATIKDKRPYETARNFTIKLARDHDFSWLISCDNDNYMPAGTPLDIIAHAGPQHNVIGMSYGVPVDGLPAYNLFPPVESRGQIDGMFQKVPAVGGGILMVNQKIWQKIPRGPWFRWNHTETETLDRGEGGYGEDVHFCKLVQQHGFDVWTHRQLLAGHYKTADVTKIVCSSLESHRANLDAVPILR